MRSESRTSTGNASVTGKLKGHGRAITSPIICRSYSLFLNCRSWEQFSKLLRTALHVSELLVRYTSEYSLLSGFRLFSRAAALL